MRWISTFVILSGGLTASYVAWPYVLPVIQSRTVWAAITLISILLFTSGHMFNQIRNVPYVAGDGKGGVSYFASGFQNQYGLETQIVAAICKLFTCQIPLPCALLTAADGILALSGISLAIKVPRMTDPKAQGIAIIAWGSILFLVYSFLLSVFRGKNAGYPFSLPPFM
jgi:oligosaccharyltransferase complex subunit gamma